MMTSLIYFQTPSSSSLPSGWELALHIWAHVGQGYADPCSRFFDHVRRSRCAWRPRSPAAPTLPHRGPGMWRCIAAGRETTSVSYRPSYRRDTRQRNNTQHRFNTCTWWKTLSNSMWLWLCSDRKKNICFVISDANLFTFCSLKSKKNANVYKPNPNHIHIKIRNASQFKRLDSKYIIS